MPKCSRYRKPKKAMALSLNCRAFVVCSCVVVRRHCALRTAPFGRFNSIDPNPRDSTHLMSKAGKRAKRRPSSSWMAPPDSSDVSRTAASRLDSPSSRLPPKASTV